MPGQAPAPGSEHVGFFHRIGEWFSNLFGIGRPHGTALTTSQQVARNVARAVAAGVATQVAAELPVPPAAKPPALSARPWCAARSAA